MVNYYQLASCQCLVSVFLEIFNGKMKMTEAGWFEYLDSGNVRYFEIQKFLVLILLVTEYELHNI